MKTWALIIGLAVAVTVVATVFANGGFDFAAPQTRSVYETSPR